MLDTALTLPISTCEYYEDKHGYQVHRRIELYVNKIELPKGWNGIQRLVKVRRWGIRNEKSFHELSFYVLSKPIKPTKDTFAKISNKVNELIKLFNHS